MRNFVLICCLAFLVYGGVSVHAQTFDATEITKLRNFLLQESAEPGVRNYQKLGLASMDGVSWSSVPGLYWNSRTYLLEQIVWPNKGLSGHLDCSDFVGLKHIYCASNDLKSVNVTNSPSLITLDLYTNDLMSIDVTTNPLINYLRLGYNHISVVDISNNPDLGFFCCTDNRVEFLDFSGKEKLYSITCLDNNLHTLIVDNCIKLETLSCTFNQLRSLRLKNLPTLKNLSCSHNLLTDLQFENCGSLDSLSCANNYLSTLDVTSCDNLRFLDCSDNQLASLYIEGCTQMTRLLCNDNMLETLDVESLPLLMHLYCHRNKLTPLTLPIPSKYNFTTYSYNPQQYIALKCDYNNVDFSDYYKVDDVISRFSCYVNTNNYVLPLENREGVLVFDEKYVGEIFIIRVMNEALPRLVMHFDVEMTRDGVNNVNPTGNQASIYASEGLVHVIAPSPFDLKIYSINGMLRLKKNIGEGRTDIPLERGVYVIVADDKPYSKLIVR